MAHAMDFDVIIIGTGQAGVPLATRLASAGRRVLIVERAELGGTCSNSGCTPTKTMIASARAAHVARTGARLGVHAREVAIDFPAIVARKDAIVKRWREGVERRLAGDPQKLTLIRGHARFVAERTIEVDRQRHRAELVVINVGARAFVPDVPGLRDVPYLNNRSVMELRELPRRLLILGGGYIGCEFGQMFRRFGAEVCIVERGKQLLGREDPEIATHAADVFRNEGIELVFDAKLARVASRDGELRAILESGQELRGSQLLVATGRRPNTDDLGCEHAGVRLDSHGFVAVERGYETSAKGVYAVGDATPGPQFTHRSWDDHRRLYERLINGAASAAAPIVPYTVFIDPQIAGVGLSEQEARARGIEYEAATMPFSAIARAIETDETAGVLNVLIDPKSESILGCRLMGAEAGELVHIFIALMQARASARAIVDAEFVHPTFAEGVQSLVMKLERYALR